MDTITDNEVLLRSLIAEEIGDLLNEGELPINRPLYLAKNIAGRYAETLKIDHLSIFPIVMMLIESLFSSERPI